MTRDIGAALLRQLAATGPIRIPVAIVVAHQDDEMICAAGSMARLLDLTIIHVTDGAPSAAAERRANGSVDRVQLARRRRAELDAALRAACARPVRRLCYDLADGEVAEHRDALSRRLVADLMSVAAVITHPYEGGHVDHDASAHALHAACAQLTAMVGVAPAIVEFASYYRRDRELRAGLFWPDPTRPEVTITLSPEAVHRRTTAFACFTSQMNNLRYFCLDTERFRLAPTYDFGRPPPPMDR